jgi:hypothetical protein
VVNAIVANLAQPVVELDLHAARAGDGRGCLAGSRHGAGVDGIHIGHNAWQPAGQCSRLPLAQFRQADVDVALLPLLEVDVALAVANEVEMHGNPFKAPAFAAALECRKQAGKR